MLKIGQKRVGFEDPLGFLEQCHRRIENFIGTIVRVAADRRETPLDDEYAEALGTALDFFAANAPKHERDEEDSLFPRMRTAEDAEIRAAIERVDAIEAEHRTLSDKQLQLEALARPWFERRTAKPAVIDEVHTLAADLQRSYGEHISIEDGDLYVVARRLPADLLAEIGREMQARRAH